MSDLIIVGAFAGAFGVHGEARLKSFTADPQAIADYAPLTDESGTRSFDITITRQINSGFAVKVEGVLTKEQADALRGTQLYAERARLPSLPDDEYYHADLVGLEVLDTGGAILGHVKSVQNHGAGDLIEVHGPTLANTVLIPFTLAAVPTVDLAAGRLIVDPPEGLL